MSAFAAELTDVSQVYGTVKALDRVSLQIPGGRMVGLIGPDGVIRYAKRGVPNPKEVLASAA